MRVLNLYWFGYPQRHSAALLIWVESDYILNHPMKLCNLLFTRRNIVALAFCLLSLAYGALTALSAPPNLTVKPAGHEGFDVWVGGKLVAPIRLSTNSVITASRVETQGHSIRVSGLRCKDPQAVTFAPDDYVSIAWSEPDPQVRFHLTLRHFDATRWKALFPDGAAPFHFLSCSMPTAQVWHQRGWLNATPNADPFPLLQDVHNNEPEISSLWNRNWSYICPLGAHPIPMIGAWNPAQSLYVGYDFQEARATDQSERYVSTAYCWRQGSAHSFFTLAYPYGGLRYGELVYPHSGEVVASHFRLIIDTNLPATEDPNERFQARLFAHYQDALPRVPAMNDLSWLPGGVRLGDFAGPLSLELFGPGHEATFYPDGTPLIHGWKGHLEMPIDTAARRGDTAAIAQARAALDILLQKYARRIRVGGETCLFWEKPLAGAWNANYGGGPVTTLHNSDAWYPARVLVELYRYDLAHGQVDPEYLSAIDGIFNWTKHFVWTRNEFADVPSSPFAIGGTLSVSFLLDYYFTFRHDHQRKANAQLALKLADHITWRYLAIWAMDSDRADGGLDSAFLLEPNSGRDWAGLACANEVHWNIDTLTQVYVHTGDARMRYYLRGILQRWPTLYRPIYETSIEAYGHDAMTEGLGLFEGAGPGRGGRYNYGSADQLPMNEPIGASKMRVVAGARAAIAFCKDGAHSDIADYRTDGAGACSFRIISTLPGAFDVSFSYPYVDISVFPIYVTRNGQTRALTPDEARRPPQAPSSLYLSQLRNGDIITLGEPGALRQLMPDTAPLTYREKEQPIEVQRIAPAFKFIPLALAKGSRPLDQSWHNPQSFAGLIPGLRWAYGVPYQQGTSTTAPMSEGSKDDLAGEHVLFIFYARVGAATGAPYCVLDNGQQVKLSGHPVVAWRAWPPLFEQAVLMDYARIPAGHSARYVTGNLMAVTAWHGAESGLKPILTAMAPASAAYAQDVANAAYINQFKKGLPPITRGSIAILPGATASSAANFLSLTGLRQQATALTPTQLIDQQQFNAQRYRVAFYLGGERYLKTVREAGDAQAALTRYLATGGTLIVLASQPYPMFYGDSANEQNGPSDPYFAKIGIPLSQAFETAPPGLEMRVAANQQIIHSIPPRFPFPSGDPRLRAASRFQIPPLSRYVPLISVQDAAGKDYGDATFYIEFGSGPAQGGKLLYIWSTLLDTPFGNKIIGDAVGWTLNKTFAQSVPGAAIF